MYHKFRLISNCLNRKLLSLNFDIIIEMFQQFFSIFHCSSLREPSHWLSKVNKAGEIFHLELEHAGQSQIIPSSDKECFCSCSDCATDDTGYGTDSDLNSSLRKQDPALKLNHSDFSDIDDVLKGSCFDVLKSSSFDINGKAIQRVEEDIDSLFQGVTISQEKCDITDLEVDIPFDIDNCFSEGEFKIDSCFNSDYAEIKDLDCNGNRKKTVKYKDFLEYSNIKENMTTKNCECETKMNSKQHCVQVDIKLRQQRHHVPDVLSTVQLCEQILGIVPGHYGSSQSANNSHRRKDRRVKIRGIVPTGVAAKYTEIRVGKDLLQI